jgi:GWxTD domain-containing protein
MRISLRVLLCAASAVCFTPAADSQQAPPAEANRADARKERKQARKAAKELGDTRWDWLEQDAIGIIITPAEREAFLKLGTNEERDQFIETFWRNRNPDPDSPENPFKEEHYRRIAYANEHFASGVPGWKTDRGHLYILWGPPDEVESHPTGGTYDRPMWQGGGSTATYAWELWRYRHLDTLGDNIEFEFVDPSGSGEYRLTRDPGEKDALLHVPGAGRSVSEMMNGGSKADRFSNSNGTTLPAPIGGLPASQDQFATLDLYFRAMRPPEHLNDLTALVSSRIVGNPIHLDYRLDYLRVTKDAVMVPITLEIPNREIAYRENHGVQSATLNLYARITTPTGRLVQSFEEAISRDVPASLFQKTIGQSSVFQKSVPLSPGLYRLDVVVKDRESGNIGVIETALRVPRFADGTLGASTLILADKIESVPATEIGLGPFVIGPYKVRPRVSREFSSAENLGLFLQVYNLERDEALQIPSVLVKYTLLADGDQVWTATETSDSIRQNGEQVTFYRLVPLAAFRPGGYKLQVEVQDRVSGQTISRETEFRIKP